MNSLQSKNILITGASSGIGRACAIECGNAGANVHLIARNSDKLLSVASILKPETNSVYTVDVTNSDGMESVIHSIVDRFGKIDGFIHSAGIQITKPFRTMNRDHYFEVFSVNTVAAFDVSRLLIKKSLSNLKGLSLVYIGSVMSVVGDAGITSYCASKAALVGGVRSMAVELASSGVRVNCVSPGTVEDTEMTDGLKASLSELEFQRIVARYPMGLGRAEDVAKLCVFLLSDDSKWITGQNIVIDGGYSSQ